MEIRVDDNYDDKYANVNKEVNGILLNFRKQYRTYT